MIFEDFQNAIVERLSADAYFSDDPGILVIAEDSPKDHGKAILNAINTVGIACAVGFPSMQRDQNNVATISVPILFWENPEKNRTEGTGTEKPAPQAATKSMALLNGYQKSTLQMFSPIKIQSSFELPPDEGDFRILWALIVQSKILYKTLVT
jgi:hypothetical protein